jgi:hypothetical protein
MIFAAEQHFDLAMVAAWTSMIAVSPSRDSCHTSKL